MSAETDHLGRRGERIAEVFLESAGHVVIERRARRREGEIDLVTRDGDALVFVEVKLRTSAAYGTAVEALGPAKRRRLSLLAEAYAADHPELPRNLRIDLVAIDLADDGAVASIAHIPNAVEG